MHESYIRSRILFFFFFLTKANENIKVQRNVIFLSYLKEHLFLKCQHDCHFIQDDSSAYSNVTTNLSFIFFISKHGLQKYVSKQNLVIHLVRDRRVSENHPEFSCPEVPVMGGKGWCLYRLPHDVLCALKAHYPPRTFVPGQREAWTVMGAECATVSSSSSRDLGWGGSQEYISECISEAYKEMSVSNEISNFKRANRFTI